MLSFETTPMFWAQVVGVIAFVLSVIRFQFQGQKTMLRLNALSNVFFAAHWYMLFVPHTAVLSLTSMFRSFSLSTEWGQKYKWYIVPALLIPSTVFSVYLAEPSWTIYILFMPFLTAFAEMRGCPQLYRKVCIGCDIAWLVFGFYTGSIGVVLACVFNLTSCGIGILRFEYPEAYATLQRNVSAMLAPVYALRRAKQPSAAE